MLTRHLHPLYISPIAWPISIYQTSLYTYNINSPVSKQALLAVSYTCHLTKHEVQLIRQITPSRHRIGLECNYSTRSTRHYNCKLNYSSTLSSSKMAFLEVWAPCACTVHVCVRAPLPPCRLPHPSFVKRMVWSRANIMVAVKLKP